MILKNWRSTPNSVESRLVLDFLKRQMQRGNYYSLPDSMFLAATAGGSDFNKTGRADAFLEAAAARTRDVRGSDMDRFTFFQVVNQFPERRHLVSVPQAARRDSCIHVSRCIVLSLKVDVKQAIVFNDYASHVVMDASVLIDHIGIVLPELYSWHVVERSSILKPSGRLAIEDTATRYDELPVLSDGGAGVSAQRASSSSSSSLAIVPLHTEPEPTDNKNIIAALREVERLSGSDSLVHVGLTGDLHHGNIEAAVQAGALHGLRDEFGELCVAINKKGVQTSVAVTLGRPVQLSLIVRDSDLLKSSKMELALRLKLDGWLNVMGLSTAWAPGGYLHFDLQWKHPVSYFAALVDRDRIVGKGVSCIAHGEKDGYYRCLLTLPPSVLASFAGSLAGHDQAWYALRLKQSGGEEDTDDMLPIADVVGEFPVSVGYGEGSIEPQIIVADLWTRKLVDSGPGTLQIKVYYDNCTGGSSKQRGWTECTVHDCRPYRPVGTREDDFLAEMYAWQMAAVTQETLRENRGEHLRHRPSAADIEHYKRIINARPF